MSQIRKAAVAGYFYPADPEILDNTLNSLLASGKNRHSFEDIFGLVSPHAGYLYSGLTAAYGFNLLNEKKYRDVIIISPSHREYFSGACIYEGDAYETPLGMVNVNHKLAGKIMEGSRSVFRGIQGHNEEHAVEVQIPFLQKILDDFEIVPVVIGNQDSFIINELAERIAAVYEPGILVIASSDLSHFYSKQKADEMDSLLSDRIETFDFGNLEMDIKSGKCEACGSGAIISLLKSASMSGINSARVIHRSDSGDVSGDNREVVGYLSAVIYGN